MRLVFKHYGKTILFILQIKLSGREIRVAESSQRPECPPHADLDRWDAAHMAGCFQDPCTVIMSIPCPAYD